MRLQRLTGDHSVRTLFAALSVAFLVLAACNNGNGEAAPDRETTDDPTEEVDDRDREGDRVGLSTAECIEAVFALSAGLAGAFVPGTDFDEGIEVFERLAADAPAEVRADFEVLAEAFAELRDMLRDAGVDLGDPTSITDPDAIASLEALGEIFDNPAVEQAADNINAYFEEVCPDTAFDDDLDDLDIDIP